MTSSGQRPPSPGAEQQPRHLRVDDRPAARQLDDTQLAAEAFAALRAEQHAAARPTETDLIPFETGTPPAVPAVDEAETSGRHRRADQLPPAPADQPGRSAPAPEPAVAAAPPRPRHDRASSGGTTPARPVALLVVALLGTVIAVLVVLLITNGEEAGAPSTPPAPAVDSTGPAADPPSLTSPATTSPVSTAPPSTSAPELVVAESTTTVADPGQDAGAARTVTATPPPPAVVSTLAPGDSGFGWPSAAFGRPR